jgi:acetyl-CoA acyltransferase
MREAVIVDAVRTPVAKGRAKDGWLAAVHPVELLAQTLDALVRRTGVDPGRVDDVIAGCVSQIGQQSFNIARNAVLAAGFPESVPGTTLDRQCGSSQQAVHFAAQGVIAGSYDAVIACGVESMSSEPMSSTTLGKDPWGAAVARRYEGGLVGQGVSAELIAARWGIDRTEMDQFAVSSHARAHAAATAGEFDAEIVPVRVGSNGTTRLVTMDQGIRPDSTLETLSALRPAFQDDATFERYPQVKWGVTAGNSSQISDGASAVLVMDRVTAERQGLQPRARFIAFDVTGADPVLMLTAVIPATARVLERAGLTVGDIDAFEVNEAFASVVLAWQRETNADLRRVNSRGGAIALGHPLGASGTRLLATLVNVLEQTGGRYGLQTMCEGGGMANATIIERLE